MPVNLRRVWSRLAAFFERSTDEGADDEIAGHLRLLEKRFEAQGMAPGEARRAARRAFGGVEQLREDLHEQQSFVWVDQIRQDMRYALRTIVRAPVVSLAIILTFALGIGANAAVFSLVNSVLLTPLPYSVARSHRRRRAVLEEPDEQRGLPHFIGSRLLRLARAEPRL